MRPGASYRYVATAVNEDGVESAGSSPIDVLVTDTTAPPVPSSCSAMAGNGQATLNCDPSACTRDIQGVNIYVGPSASGPFNKINASPVPFTGRSVSWTQSGLQNGITCYFVLTSVDFYGNESAQSSVLSVMPTE